MRVSQPTSGYLILLASNPALALTRSSSGVTLQTVSEDLEESQLWSITNAGTTVQVDGRTLEDGVYYINSLSSRTFMIMNSATATTPILKAGTESALGDKMAWNIRYIGGGYYMIESVYAPRYYLTVSSSGVAMEFLSTESVPNKAKFTIRQNGSEYLIKSGTNHYLAKSSSADTIGTATSALERAKWRMCLNTEYEELSNSFSLTNERTICVGKHEFTLSSHTNTATWCSPDDFKFSSENTSVATTDNTADIVWGKKPGTVTISVTHIVTGQTKSYSFVFSILPTSGSEIEYNPDSWNNDTSIKSSTNCYCYAFDTQRHPDNENDYSIFMEELCGDPLLLQPGALSGTDFLRDRNDINASNLLYYIQRDAEAMDFVFEPIDKNASCPAGTYKVALVMDTEDVVTTPNEVEKDYHWYRQNPDGTWSHKRGNTEVTLLDANNEVIYDPEYADRNYSFEYSYETFVGFFAITPIR